MITIREILTLKNCSSFRLVAGENGLDRKVSIGAFIDHEGVDELRESRLINEMMFSNLPMIKGHPEQIVNFIEALIISGTACFALKTTLFKEFSEEAIVLANKHDYPLFLFDDILIDNLIRDIHEIVDERRYFHKQLKLIEKIQNGNLKQNEIRSLAYKLNKYFQDYIMVCLMNRPKMKTPIFDINIARALLGKTSIIIPMDDAYLAIISSSTENMNDRILIQKLGIKPGDYHIGVSSVANDLGLLDKLITESKIALKYVLYKKEFVRSFKTIGIYQLLITLLEKPNTLDFYTEITEKLIKYDKEHQSDLLNTAIKYIHSDGNIKNTAKSLYQHENTIRYRIRRIEKLLNLEEFVGMKYETLALAIHLYELDKNIIKF